MPELTFRSPNYFDREIDLSTPTLGGPTGTPAGIIGSANKGPAFVPVTVANMDEFIATFGNLDPKRFGPYAVNEFLKNRGALTYLRVLGAGANITDGNIATTQTTGKVNNAGFYLNGIAATDDSRGRHNNCVQILAARHTLAAEEAAGAAIFTDNNSYSGNIVNVVRGLIMTTTSSRVMILDGNASTAGVFTAAGPTDVATISSGLFKLVISSSSGAVFGNSDGIPGIRVISASLDPSSDNYYAKILNSDPEKFLTEQHVVYADFPVDNEIAVASAVAIMSGSAQTSQAGGDTTMPFRQIFGAYNTRFSAARTTSFISQPFGNTEYDLFYFEAIDDGEYANQLYKVTIADLAASADDSNPYGSFNVQIRDFNDSDLNPRVIEQFPNCNLNPNSDRYVAKVIGDRKVFYNFDSSLDSERRLVASGKYPNQSKYVRIQMTDAVDRGLVPEKTLPFGFRGLEALKTNDLLTDTVSAASRRLAGVMGVGVASSLTGAILPPVPYRVKITKGSVPISPGFLGAPGPSESTNSNLTWGVKFERYTTPLNANIVSEKNGLLANLAKFVGIKKLDALVTGSGADTFNNNKFSLSLVALSNGSTSDLTSSIETHMREAAYIRNGKITTSNYTVENRITLAGILASQPALTFNKFSPYAKFTNMFYGGFDGLNSLDKSAARQNDRATSFEGCAGVTYRSAGMSANVAGAARYNNSVASYNKAIDIMTDPSVINTNLLVIPGIREPFITDYASKKVKDYGLACYVMDIPSYDDNNSRIFDEDISVRPDVDNTADLLDARGIDNNYVATYFPDIYIDDATNKRKVKVPASIAAVGALGFNDRVAYPWFAPAGFNRAALDFVSNVVVRLNSSDRDRLQDSRINPIAIFPRLGYVIYGQKTLQVNKSALDRVNVRRLLLEVKRIIIGIAQKMVFEQNTPAVRNQFVAQAIQQLGLIQLEAGVESFQVIMNETNNTQLDVDLNRLNGRIIVVPTRVIELIALDFIISNSGVAFL